MGTVSPYQPFLSVSLSRTDLRKPVFRYREETVLYFVRKFHGTQSLPFKKYSAVYLIPICRKKIIYVKLSNYNKITFISKNCKIQKIRKLDFCKD